MKKFVSIQILYGIFCQLSWAMTGIIVMDDDPLSVD